MVVGEITRNYSNYGNYVGIAPSREGNYPKDKKNWEFTARSFVNIV